MKALQHTRDSRFYIPVDPRSGILKARHYWRSAIGRIHSNGIRRLGFGCIVNILCKIKRVTFSLSK